jgi:hypothetical protein
LKYVNKYFAALFLCAGALFAEDNQLPGSESLWLYGHPRFITSANSAAGGPLFSAGSYSLIMNPALPADLQCPALDLGYAGILNAFVEDDVTHAVALRLGGSVPTRLGVFSLGFNGVMGEEALRIGNAFAGRLGWARDVTRHFYLGLSVTGGALTYKEDFRDFYFAADVGAWLRFEQVAFFRQLRFGVALQNLGKTYSNFGPKPPEGIDEIKIRMYPGIITPKIGVAAHLVEANNFALGISMDIAFPAFTNFAFNAGLQALVAEFLYISAGWDLNAQELVSDFNPDKSIHLPYIGIGVKFAVNTSGSQLFKKRGFDQTDITVDGVWQMREKDVHLYSIGAAASFGVRDTIPPEIKIGNIKND